jgi:hypothetical protein
MEAKARHQQDGEATPSKLNNSLMFLDMLSLSLFLFNNRDGSG